ncbi:MAG TPA: methyl-accepting chemotaxis protein, partial [Anaeromyxobacteraceae bacterium]|nr:methyl-accepting chemotaxis protein [Anaeromyxobacteraceae bacterium]
GAAGEGFRRVAEQMMGHADEARRSATRAKGILAEVHRAMVAALTASENGRSRAEAGAQVVRATAEAIRRLAKALGESSHAAREIARVAQQQENAIEQVLQAMNEIFVATEDTVASTHLVAREAKSLNELAAVLRRAVKY